MTDNSETISSHFTELELITSDMERWLLYTQHTIKRAQEIINELSGMGAHKEKLKKITTELNNLSQKLAEEMGW